jgi:hypothetical protein
MRRACLECPAIYEGGMSCPDCGAPGEPLPQVSLGPRTQTQKEAAFERIEDQLREAHRTEAGAETIQRLTSRYARAWWAASYARRDP